MNRDANYQAAICNRCKVVVNVKKSCVLTSIWQLTVNDDLDLGMSPIKMCVLMKCIHMPHIKLLSAIGEKL